MLYTARNGAVAKCECLYRKMIECENYCIESAQLLINPLWMASSLYWGLCFPRLKCGFGARDTRPFFYVVYRELGLADFYFYGGMVASGSGAVVDFGNGDNRYIKIRCSVCNIA